MGVTTKSIKVILPKKILSHKSYKAIKNYIAIKSYIVINSYVVIIRFTCNKTKEVKKQVKEVISCDVLPVAMFISCFVLKFNLNTERANS